MKKILLGSVATGALVAAGSASAADLGPRPAYKAPPMVAPIPVFSWTGCFVGAHGGWGWGKKDVTEVARSHTNTIGSATAGIDTSGAIFGGQIGCDYQFASSPTLQASSEGNLTTVRTDWLASITARLGFTGWLPHSLLYVKGGGAWIRDRWQTTVPHAFCDFGCPVFESSQTRSGWTIGGGIEYAIAPNWSVFAEFDHYDFGTKRVLSFTASAGGFLNLDAKQRIEAVKLGVNYRFGWGKGKAPVVAKY